jgi:hypothetical protein
MVRPRAVPSGAGASELQRSAPRQVNPPRRSEERLASARQLYDGSDHPDSDSLQRHRSRGRSSDSASTPSAPPVAEPSAARGACSHCLSGAAEPRMSMCPLSPAGAAVRPRPSQRPGVSPRTNGGECCRR